MKSDMTIRAATWPESKPISRADVVALCRRFAHWRGRGKARIVIDLGLIRCFVQAAT